MKREKKLDSKDLLRKNPTIAKVFASNQKKLAGRKPRPQKEYGLGLPYARPALVATTDFDEVFHTELYAR